MDSTSRLPRYVVDASVATKWQIRDEPLTIQADALLQAYRNGHIELLAPDCIWYEVSSAIRKASRTHRFTPEEARASIADFAGLRLPTVGSNDLVLPAYDLALRFGCSLYDGLYLALSEASGYSLVHADRRLHNALAGRVTREIWLEDWSL